jgi:hypothetical protein
VAFGIFSRIMSDGGVYGIITFLFDFNVRELSAE